MCPAKNLNSAGSNLITNPNHFEDHEEKIEILSTQLLDQNREVIQQLKALASSLRLEFGWHYLLDLTWAIQNLGPATKLKILDAGGGVGILQWYLAQVGAEVFSVDRTSRALLPLRFRNRFSVRGLTEADLSPAERVFLNYFKKPLDEITPRQITGRALAIWRDLVSFLKTNKSSGSVTIYQQDLSHLVDFQDQTFDAVVSISALEHNSPENLVVVVKELMRVLKPGGALIATLGAARDQDWYHQPSSGWCYSDAALRRLFELSPEISSNFNKYDVLFKALKECDELRKNLAQFYSQSSETGMPGGIWNPEYIPVGVIKIHKKI